MQGAKYILTATRQFMMFAMAILLMLWLPPTTKACWDDCLDKVRSHPSLAEEIQIRQKRILKKIQHVKTGKKLSDKVRQKMISILENHFKTLQELSTSIDSWKCKNIRVPKIGGWGTLDIQHPDALILYSRECLGEQLKALRQRLEKMRDTYKELNVDNLCEKLASNPRLKKRLDAALLQGTEMKAAINRIQELIDVADECMQSIIIWATNKRRKKSICGLDIACQKAWNSILRELEQNIRAARRELIKEKNAVQYTLKETTSRISNMSVIAQICY